MVDIHCLILVLQDIGQNKKEIIFFSFMTIEDEKIEQDAKVRYSGSQTDFYVCSTSEVNRQIISYAKYAIVPGCVIQQYPRGTYVNVYGRG